MMNDIHCDDGFFSAGSCKLGKHPSNCFVVTECDVRMRAVELGLGLGHGLGHGLGCCRKSRVGSV